MMPTRPRRHRGGQVGSSAPAGRPTTGRRLARARARAARREPRGGPRVGGPRSPLPPRFPCVCRRRPRGTPHAFPCPSQRVGRGAAARFRREGAARLHPPPHRAGTPAGARPRGRPLPSTRPLGATPPPRLPVHWAVGGAVGLWRAPHWHWVDAPAAWRGEAHTTRSLRRRVTRFVLFGCRHGGCRLRVVPPPRRPVDRQAAPTTAAGAQRSGSQAAPIPRVAQHTLS